MGAFVIQGHGVENYYNTNKGLVKNNVLHSLIVQNTKKDGSYYRTYSSLASSSASNDEMRNNYNGFNFFHSIYNYNTADISNWSSITNGTAPGSWSGTYVEKRINLDTLLGVKYYFVEDDYFRYQSRGEVSSENFHYNVPYNYVDITSEYPNSQFRVYKNMDYVDFALTYDKVFFTEGDPTVADKYEGLYTTSGAKDVLGIEEVYMQGVIVNKTVKVNEGIEEAVSNCEDISNPKMPVPRVSEYYRKLNVKPYGHDALSEATITYYDILSGVNSKGQKVNSLGLTAREYIELLNRDNDTFEKHAAPPENKRENREWVAVIDIKSSAMNYIYDENGYAFYIKGSYAAGAEMDFYFVDEDNKIVTYDNHNDGFYNNTRVGKDNRGFYITPIHNSDGSIKEAAPRIQKIIVAFRGSKPSTMINVIYTDKYTNFASKYQMFKDYAVTDVKSTANTYKFKTNFEKQRVIVTRLAYEDGFSVVMTDSIGKKQNLDIFMGQGGFVSFFSGKGECSYELSFYTPYLSTASLLSALGIFTYVGSLAAYLYIDLRKKEKDEFRLFLRTE